MTTPFTFLTLEIADALAIVTVNRPDKLNALNATVIAELDKAFTELAQREQVRAIMQNYRDEGRAIGEKARAAFEALRKASEGTVDETVVTQQGLALGAVIGEAAIVRAKVRNEVFAILTPEQQAEANKLQARRQQRMEQLKQRMEQRRPARQQPPQPEQF